MMPIFKIKGTNVFDCSHSEGSEDENVFLISCFLGDVLLGSGVFWKPYGMTICKILHSRLQSLGSTHVRVITLSARWLRQVCGKQAP